jgi:hypothetical protein
MPSLRHAPRIWLQNSASLKLSRERQLPGYVDADQRSLREDHSRCEKVRLRGDG